MYFSASLELQEELIKHGFQVPRSRDSKIKMYYSWFVIFSLSPA